MFSRSGKDKAVAEPGNGLYINRVIRGVIESGAEAVHGRIQASLKVNKSARGPKLRPQHFTGNKFTRLRNQSPEQLSRFQLQLYPDAMFEELQSVRLKFEKAKTN